MNRISKISTLLLLSAFLFINCEKDKVLDCNGVEDGTAYLDECDECVGGTTGKEPCTEDCNGVTGGTAYLDDCDECVGGTTDKEPCLNDTRDGKIYKTVKIGDQVWMAENLNYTTGNSWCYGNTAANCNTYGRLYDWETALTACPTGWRLPSDAEWTVLTTYLGGETVAGGKMKSTTGWNAPNTDATNSSGFTGLPGGSRRSNGNWSLLGPIGYWWSSTENDINSAWGRTLYSDIGDVNRHLDNKGAGLACRCLRD